MKILVIFKLYPKHKKIKAGVAQLGQRRKVEVLIPKGFVGSNPISRISITCIKETIKY